MDTEPLAAAARLRVYEGARFHLKQVYDAAKDVRLPTTEEDDWTLLWSYKSPWATDTLKRKVASTGPTAADRAVPYAVNHMPGTLSIASKAHLISFASALRQVEPQRFGSGLLPESYLLPEQKETLDLLIRARGVVDAAGLPRWLIKSKQHRGIRVLVNASRRAIAAEGEAIVQERVRPLLLRGVGRAFDVGLYVLVTSVEPLRVYAYEHSLVRFCKAEYPRSAAGFGQLDRFVVKEYTPVWLMPFFYTRLAACNRSASCALRLALRDQGVDDHYLWSSMYSMSTSLLAALQPTVLRALSRQRVAAPSTFELFRFDFLVDAWARPVLTEVNLSPNLVGVVREDAAVKRKLLVDTLRLAANRFRPTHTLPSPRGVQCDPPAAAGRSGTAGCCHMTRRCANHAARRACLSAAELRQLRLAAAEAATPGDYRRIWPPPKAAANVRGSTPMSERTRRFEALQECWLGIDGVGAE